MKNQGQTGKKPVSKNANTGELPKVELNPALSMEPPASKEESTKDDLSIDEMQKRISAANQKRLDEFQPIFEAFQKQHGIAVLPAILVTVNGNQPQFEFRIMN